ncbi:putative M19 family peptidase [Gordonia polyisoprenivorans VH2]|uniref:Putative M19 family peptidase n=1 Tax=Gordonia polyisoprenivorans (strain DSM 44266 / VH2) TaxID=1112204 RepID=H6MYQ7_GORPV|nr:membrane dipeptidase [Gordonia polyisoprenivorans]AFA71935.1 putative M19 family peptidase [Gordonia polyisoprenivorans VH2]OZC33782.1 membrane dipeptidase [Gordonia polyisoprenivorans]UZF57229.1 dipeptidase [Gordonia polyisoprenivorans]WCB38312.1 membrane dipeptidase [Gordonia polyisoprenivorans]
MTLLWDQHACLPLQPDADVGYLRRFDRNGPTYVSVNVGYSPQSFDDSSLLLTRFRAAITDHPGLALATTPSDIEAAVGRIAVAFDLEDSNPLDGDLDNVARFVDLGVRTMLPSYNHANRAGCGCLDTDDTGLTAWGRDLVAEMNSAGMVPDGSHCSVRTGLDLCEVSSKPVIYSHSCMRGVWDHPRNITDDQARACAATGGVVGITGVGIFLGPNTPTLEAMTRHLEYAVELVGIEHVGVSTDHSFDAEDFLAEIRDHPEAFDESYTRWGPIRWMAPEVFVTLGSHLAQRGWAADDITAVLGGNFRRVAECSW